MHLSKKTKMRVVIYAIIISPIRFCRSGNRQYTNSVNMRKNSDILNPEKYILLINIFPRCFASIVGISSVLVLMTTEPLTILFFSVLCCYAVVLMLNRVQLCP